MLSVVRAESTIVTPSPATSRIDAVSIGKCVQPSTSVSGLLPGPESVKTASR